MQDIKTIDFSEAEMDCDVEIDLGFKMVVNKDVDIIPNEHIYVVGKWWYVMGGFWMESPIYFIKIVKISTIYYLSIAGFEFYV